MASAKEKAGEPLGPQPPAVADVLDIDSAEAALRELSWHLANVDLVNLQAEAAIAQINENAEQARSPSKTRAAELEAALLKWGDRNRATLCPGKTKSAELRGGTFSWRKAGDSVDPLKGWTAAECKDGAGQLEVGAIEIEAGDTLVSALQTVVDAVGYRGALTVSLGISKKVAYTEYKVNKLDDDQLAVIGHEFKAGDEYIKVEPAKYVREGK